MMNRPAGSKRKIRRPLATVLVLAAAAALLALSVAGPATARDPGAKAKARPFACFAVVSAVNAQGGTFTATVSKGNRAVKDYVGKDVAFTVAANAVIVKLGGGDPATVALSAIAVGDRVHLLGRVDLSRPGAPGFTAHLVVDRGPKPLKS